MANRVGVVSASVLNIRTEPSTGATIIGTLSRGEPVTIVERAGSWYKISASPVEGYVYGDYIVIKETNHVSGFLLGSNELQQITLEPVESEKILVRTDFTSEQRAVAQTWNSQGNLLLALSNVVEVDVAASVSVLCVESSGRGFNPDGSMVIRFENHIFWRQWGKDNRESFNKQFRYNPESGWQGHEFREDADSPWTTFHGNQMKEWRVFTVARMLNEPAAMRSISMGTPQIMGFNHASIGYDSVQGMFDAFRSDVRYQTCGLFDFIRGAGTTSPMLVALQRQKFVDFASRYNGNRQAAEYGERIAKHFEVFKSLKG